MATLKKEFSRLIVTEEMTFSTSSVTVSKPEDLVEAVREQIVGENILFTSPFGDRKVTYADYTASGRSVGAIESFISDVVLPCYANTHTTTSFTGHQTSLFRNEARMLVKRLVNANFSHGNDKDVVVFHGSGVTGCINLMVAALGLLKPSEERAVVFVSPFEHHSNLLPWREAEGCEVVVINALPDSFEMDLSDLENKLIKYSTRRLRIGSFVAASNVSGALADVHGISSILHRHGALSFWDYATAGPYVKIDMNVSSENYLDAVFLSPHKFLGGPGSPGILVVKKRLLKGKNPAFPGGGTVFFVTESSQRYLRKEEERFEAGTQDIVGSIRAALAMKLKATIGENWIEAREFEILNMARRELSKNPNLVLLSPAVGKALPVISFVVLHSSGRMLHHNFVCTLLNDLFGIQVRGGCMCAGPFAEKLLGMSQELAAEYEAALVAHDDSEMIRPGFARLSLHYTMSDATVEFLLKAVNWVANHGWQLLPEYSFDRSTSEWYHPATKKFPDRRWLADLNFSNTGINYTKPTRVAPADLDLNDYFVQANDLLKRRSNEKRPSMALVEGTEHLRWFVLPQEIGDKSVEGMRFSKLEQSPLKTFRFVTSNENASTTASSGGNYVAAAPAASVAEELDDFFGVMEGEDGKDEIVDEAPSVTAAAPAASDGVCELRPSWRDPIDLEEAAKKKNSNVKWHVPPQKTIWKKTREAIFEFDMIRPGDKVLVCVSGGKDSLSLLHTLHFLRSKMGEGNSFEIGAVTVDPMTVSFDPRPLIPYMAALGVTYHYEQQPLIDNAKEANASSICSWCSRMKRGIIYRVARTHGYNVVAMGQHLDDMCESFMMSFWLNGKLRTQKACYVVDEGDLRFIRPFAYVRERDLKQFALSVKLPVISETCPACFAEPKERARLKQLLENQEAIYPNMYYSMCGAMDPLMRNLPITAADHEREREMQVKMGKGPSLVPGVTRAVVLMAVGAIIGCIFSAKN